MIDEDDVPFGDDRWYLRALSKVEPQQIKWLVPWFFPLGYLTLVAAVGGVGKSHYMIALAAQGSVAAEPWDTIYVSFEDGTAEVLRPRLEAAGGDPNRVHELVLNDSTDMSGLSLPRDLDELQRLVRKCSARLVVIDPVVAAIDTKLDAYKDQHVRQVLGQLWRISMEEICAVSMVGHLNRVPSTDAFLRIANSMAFWNAARSVVLLTPEGNEEEGVRLVSQRKANLARLASIERHVIEEIVLPHLIDSESGKPIVSSRLRFVEIAQDVDASGILGPQTPTKAESAETLLEVLLADGEWHESAKLKQVLKTAGGHSEMTAKRAAEALGVEYDRRGFPSVTWWRLPVGPA